MNPTNHHQKIYSFFLLKAFKTLASQFLIFAEVWSQCESIASISCLPSGFFLKRLRKQKKKKKHQQRAKILFFFPSHYSFKDISTITLTTRSSIGPQAR
jgi:hypothetical protein